MDQITTKFPHKVFPIIQGEPNYHRIHDMWNLLYGNAPTLSTTLGGGNHRNIRIVMRDTLYATIYPTPYSDPVDPGGKAQVTTQATMEVCSQLRDQHAEDHHIHDNYHNIGAALKNMVL